MIVTKRGEVAFSDVKVEDLFEYLQEMYGQNPNIDISISCEPYVIYGEINLLKSVLLNLVDNAIKASEENGRIEVRGCKVEKGYHIWVQDYGVGIPEEECKKITEAFYMVDKSRSRSKNGAGLGLALCTAILELHHSRLEIKSVLGEGSNIGFVLSDKEVAAREQEEI